MLLKKRHISAPDGWGYLFRMVDSVKKKSSYDGSDDFVPICAVAEGDRMEIAMLQNRLKSLRKERGMTLEDLANRIGTSKQTIQRYESGVIANVPMDKVEAMAKILGVTPAVLMGWENADDVYQKFDNLSPLYTRALPVVGHIACGKPVYAEQEYEGYASVDDRVDADFCLRTNGDSMIGARIFDGDIVFIRRQEWVDNGEIAAVAIGDEATLKRVYYYPEQQKLILSPENPRYEPLVFLGAELRAIKILGKAVAFQSRVR